MIIWNLLLGGIAGYLVERASDWLLRAYSPGKALALTPRRHSWLRVVSTGISALFFVLAGHYAGTGLRGAAVLVAYCYLYLLALTDLKYHIVPNRLVYPVAAGVFLYYAIFSSRPLILTLVGGLLAFGVFALTAFLRPNDLGGGDIKLAALIGLAFGFPGALWALLLGTFIGGTSMFFLRVMNPNRTRQHLPYAPFLCLGAMIAMLYNPIELLLSSYL